MFLPETLFLPTTIRIPEIICTIFTGLQSPLTLTSSGLPIVRLLKRPLPLNQCRCGLEVPLGLLPAWSWVGTEASLRSLGRRPRKPARLGVAWVSFKAYGAGRCMRSSKDVCVLFNSSRALSFSVHVALGVSTLASRHLVRPPAPPSRCAGIPAAGPPVRSRRTRLSWQESKVKDNGTRWLWDTVVCIWPPRKLTPARLSQRKVPWL